MGRCYPNMKSTMNHEIFLIIKLHLHIFVSFRAWLVVRIVCNIELLNLWGDFWNIWSHATLLHWPSLFFIIERFLSRLCVKILIFFNSKFFVWFFTWLSFILFMFGVVTGCPNRFLFLQEPTPTVMLVREQL